MPRSDLQWRFAACLLIMAIGMASHVFLHFTPGALSQDSFSILAQARAGIFEDGHPPLMAAIWRVIDKLLPGSIGVLLLNLGLFYGGLLLIFRWALPRYKGWVLPAFLVAGMFPPVLGILGAIWIDITMAGFFLLALGIFLIGSTCASKGQRATLYFATLLCTFLGIAIRHNAAAAGAPLITFFLFQIIRSKGSLLTRVIAAMIGGLLVTVLLFLGARQVSSILTDVPRHLWRVAAVYDIAGTSHQENVYLFYPDVIKDNSLDNVRTLYSPRSLAPLFLGQQIHALPEHQMAEAKPLQLNLSNTSLDERLSSNWMSVIFEHPAAYLRHRYNVFTSLITRSPWGLWAPVFDAVYPNDLGIAERPVRRSVYFDWSKWLVLHTPLFIPLSYLILNGVALLPTLLLGLRLQNQPLLVAAALYGSGLAHMAGLFLTAASADFRYSHWLITATVLATSLVALEMARAIHGTYQCATWSVPQIAQHASSAERQKVW